MGNSHCQRVCQVSFMLRKSCTRSCTNSAMVLFERTHEEFHARHRQLIDEDEINWFNDFPMFGVRTEYYYRYSGSQSIPPCNGTFDPRYTNHWRVMKEPIRIHPSQRSVLLPLTTRSWPVNRRRRPKFERMEQWKQHALYSKRIAFRTRRGLLRM